MKRILPLLLTAALLLGLTACSGDIPETSQTPADISTAEPDNSNGTTVPGTESGSSGSDGEDGILIAYFTMPEDVDAAGVDAVAGASIVVQDGEVLGNVEYMANTIQSAVGGDLFRIQTVQQYPLEHEALIEQAANEQDENARPELATHIENPDGYDTILLGYPNWWGDMPQALYTFLEEYDFSGKTIIPFCPHGGSGFSRTLDTIAELQPGATVSENGLTISRNDVAGSAEEIAAWAEGLGL